MKNNLIILTLAVVTFMGCSKQLEFEPVDDQILTEDALQTSGDYEALLNSCYDVLANTFNGKAQKLSFVMSDNAGQPNSNDDLTEAYNFNTLIFNGTIDDYFKQPYIAIRRCNSLLGELTPDAISSLGFPDGRGEQLLAEARFIRALAYFDLVRKFGHPYGYQADNSQLGVVLRTEPVAEILPRASVAEIYSFMISELTELTDILDANTAEYASSYGAHALLAKIYFYQNDFENAALHASEVINSGVFSLDSASRYSESLSPESIFAIISTDADRRSGEMQGLFNTGGQPTLGLSREVYDIIAANPEDRRNDYLVLINEGQANEIVGYNLFNATFFNMPVLHLTDMLLIRAESYAETGANVAQAINDINQVKERAYRGNLNFLLTPSAGPQSIIREARLERRLETIGEAERLFDLKRIGTKGEDARVRGVDWDCNGMILQFPADEQTQLFVLNPSGGDC